MEKYLNLLADLPLFENIDSRDIPPMLNCLHAQKGKQNLSVKTTKSSF